MKFGTKQGVRYAAFALWLVVAATIAALLGDAEPSRADSTRIAFAVRTVGGSDLYVLDARDVQTRIQGVPPGARLVTRHSDDRVPDAIASLTWSPDGSRILYLLDDASGDYPNYSHRIDLWSVNVDGTGRMLLEPDFVEPEVSLSHNLADLIDWDGNGRRYRLRREPRTSSDDAVSSDGRLIASREWGIDSNWICVADARSSREEERPTRFGCFGDGFFTRPEWAPR